MKLYHNLGNGTFADITGASGITLPLTNLSATSGDIDLLLHVLNGADGEPSRIRLDAELSL